MTLLLIALIAAGFIELYQRGDIVSKERERRKRTRTNVSLESRLRGVYYQQIYDELLQLLRANSDIDAFDALEYLYYMHDIPTKNAYEMEYPEWYGVSSPSGYYDDFKFNLARKDFKKKYKTDGGHGRSKSARRDLFDGYYHPATALIERMVKRTLYKHGYHKSPDGVHESEWQEQEKNAPALEANRKKYPWMFGL